MPNVAKAQPAAMGPGSDAALDLLEWWDRERRDLPWRTPPGRAPDAYRIWLSEIMLQQTTVKAVIPYYQRFLARWPTVEALAAAPLEEVLAAWAGLGYYSRARNLHKCARMIAEAHAGRFPTTSAALVRLPGVGPYTAAAIAAIAFGEPATPVDGNIERVVARLFAVKEPLPAAKPTLRRLAGRLAPSTRAGDFAQALMDLGAGLCTPKRPSCLVCPLQGHCAAHAEGLAAHLPLKPSKADRPLRVGLAFVALREDGTVLLRRRPEAGLLGGMLEVPSTAWSDALPPLAQALRAAPVHGQWWAVPGSVAHTFTHFRLELIVYRAVVPNEVPLTFWADPQRCRWVPRRSLNAQALPSVMRKVLAHGLKEQ
jgi:A/G-specific adenine glycosylase